MLFQRINRTSPDKVFVLGLNVGATTVTNGMVVALANASTTPAATLANTAAAQALGVRYTKYAPGFGVEIVQCPASTATNLVAQPCGVWADVSAATGVWGLYQVYGAHDAILATAGTMVNACLVAGTTAGKVDDGAATVSNDPRIFVGYPAVAWSATSVAGFIRLM